MIIPSSPLETCNNNICTVPPHCLLVVYYHLYGWSPVRGCRLDFCRLNLTEWKQRKDLCIWYNLLEQYLIQMKQHTRHKKRISILLGVFSVFVVRESENKKDQLTKCCMDPKGERWGVPAVGRPKWPLPVIDMLIPSIHSTSLSLFPTIKANVTETVIKLCPGKRLPAAFNEAALILPLFAIGLSITSTGLR